MSNLKITALKPFACWSPITDWTYVKVETNDPKIYGWGECSLPSHCHGVMGAIRDLEKLVIGYNPLETEHCWQRMYRHGFWRGGPIMTSALSGVDTALWDIRGKVWEKPLHALLGGTVRKRIRLYANLGLSTSPDTFRQRAEHAISLGYTAVKIYPLPATQAVESPATIKNVVACCEAIRETIGWERDFAVDLHGRPSASLAVQLESALRPLHPLWLEEPVLPEVPNALTRCAEKFETPIATGERLYLRWAFRELLEKELVSIIQPDVSNAGGVSEMHRIASLAEMYNVAFNPHNPNGPLQSLTSLHLAASAPAFNMLEHRHEAHDHMKKVCSHLIQVDEDGCVAPPEGFGIGAEMDEKALLAHPPEPWIPEEFHPTGSIAEW